jgi:hypothetical protein
MDNWITITSPEGTHSLTIGPGEELTLDQNGKRTRLHFDDLAEFVGQGGL